MKLSLFTIVLALLFAFEVNAQGNRRLWHVYAGPSVGTMYYVGEMKRNSLPEEEYLNVFAGMRVAAQYKRLIAVQLSYTYGGLSGYDSLTSAQLANRNYQFQTQTHDVELLAKLTLFNHNKRVTRSTPYVILPKLVAGVGMLHFDPFVDERNQRVYLRDLGTEGQMLGLPGYAEAYSNWALGIKFGGEISIETGPRTFVDFYGYYTFAQTDYIDDLGGGNHIDVNDLEAAKDPVLLRRYAYPSTAQDITSTPGHTRGNPATNDGFFSFGVSVSYRLTELSKNNGYMTIPLMNRRRF